MFYLLYGPAHTTVCCDHWEDRSLGYTNFGSRDMSLLFNTLSRFVIAFLPRSNCLLISWLQLPSTISGMLCQIPPLWPSEGQRFTLSNCKEPWLTTSFLSEFQSCIYPWWLTLYSLLMTSAGHVINLDIMPGDKPWTSEFSDCFLNCPLRKNIFV